MPKRDGLGRLPLLAALVCACLFSGIASAQASLASGPPVNSEAPVVKGKLLDGKKVKAGAGRWEGTKPLSYAYAWERCDAAGEACAAISGANGATYVLHSEDVGHTLRVLVTAKNSDGEATARSKASGKVAPAPPKKLKPATISGALIDGKFASVDTGSWKGTTPMTFAYRWESCEGSCHAIPGATEPTYRISSHQVSQKLRVEIRATNQAGFTEAFSKKSGVVAPGPPVNLGPPEVFGTPTIGDTLTALNGTWGGTGPFTFTYQWRSCNLLGECSDIAGATQRTYKVQPLDALSSLEVVVTATNNLGSASAASARTNPIEALLPVNTLLPTVTGLLKDGGLLSAVTGAWEGTGPLSFSYAWELCDAAGANCHELEGELSPTLSLLSTMVGSTVRLVVTATNSAGSTSATSEATSLVAALLPAVSKLPSISGLLQDGSLLSALTGSWTGTGPLSFAYQWEQCDSSGLSCEALAGQTGSTLGLLTGLIGSTVRVAVTATNGAGSVTATSPVTGLIKGLLPSNLGLPGITGLLEDGGLLSAFKGTWSGSEPLSFSYAWELCDKAGAHCEALEGALSSTLSLVSSMVGRTVRLAVTATNSTGSTTATSEPTGLVGALLPSVTKVPSISGLAEDGQSLLGALGSWAGSEPSLSEQWQLCNAAGEACKDVAGQTGSSLSLLTGMIGETVRLVVTATNDAGSVSAASQPTSPVLAILPSVTKPPSISGLLEDGQSLLGALGSWAGSEPSLSEQWQLCNAAGEACKDVAGQTGSSLSLLTGMIGETVRLVVTATNSRGSASAASAATSPVLAILPKVLSAPTIAGVLEDGQALTGAKGTWVGSEPSYSYKWLLCNSSGKECGEVSGATGTTLGLLTSEIGKTVKLAVTATNSRGSATAESAPTSAILAILPKLLSAPAIGGTVEDGHTLTGTKGTWEGSEPAFTYSWESCNGAECKPISGATGTTLGLTESLIGKTVRLAVTATNSRGSVTQASSPTSSVLAILPAKATVPTIAGILQVGKLLEALPNGSWTGSENPGGKVKYQWQTCGLLGKENECKDLAGAITSILKLELAQVGLTMRVLETATNSRGSVTKASSITSTILGLLLSPTNGPAEGGTAVTLAAPGVAKASAVHFGSAKTTEIEVDSPDEITVTAPAGTEGTVPVTVTTPEGTTHETPEDRFTYE